MNTDTFDFLVTLLSLADDPDAETHPFINSTVNDFSPAFVEGAEKFIAAFRSYLEAEGYGHLIDAGERSFGENVFFSLSGHGCGFFDDTDGRVSNLQGVIEEWSKDGGRKRRFEELETGLDVGKDGVIDLAILPQFLEKQRAALFAVPSVIAKAKGAL